MRGARPRSPAATSSVISATARKPSWNAAQCSRSAAWRDHLADLRRQPAPRPLRHRLAEGLGVVQPGREQERQRRPDQQVVEAAAHPVVEPGLFLGVQDRAAVGVELAGGPRVHDDQSRLGVEVAREAPPVARRMLVGPLGQLVDGRRDVELARRRRTSRSAATAGRPRGRPARGSPGAGRSSTTPSPPTIRSCHQGFRSIFCFHDQLVFQSSRMSWSSKIIALGSVESSQRFAGSLQASL